MPSIHLFNYPTFDQRSKRCSADDGRRVEAANKQMLTDLMSVRLSVDNPCELELVFEADVTFRLLAGTTTARSRLVRCSFFLQPSFVF
jgi:hypothetical protein